MPIDHDFDRPLPSPQREKSNVNSLMHKDMNLWASSLERAVISEPWRNMLLEETGAPDLPTLGNWVVKAQHEGWTATQMVEEMKKSLQSKK